MTLKQCYQIIIKYYYLPNCSLSSLSPTFLSNGVCHRDLNYILAIYLILLPKADDQKSITNRTTSLNLNWCCVCVPTDINDKRPEFWGKWARHHENKIMMISMVTL